MAHNACPICANELRGNETARGICDECSAANGLVAMPPAKRPPAPCQRCRGAQLIRAIPRELSIDTTIAESNFARHTPMFVTYQPQVQKKMFGGYKAADLDPSLGRGVLELYICTGCGFVEWYCHGPVPIGPQYMTELVEYQAD